jgi:RNA-binding protein YhbY
MKKEELLELLKEIKVPEPDEETLLRSEEELIKKVRNPFFKIQDERRLIIMKNFKTKIVYVTIVIIIAMSILSALVIIPKIKVLNAKQIAQKVIMEELHQNVNIKDISVNGNIASVFTIIYEDAIPQDDKIIKTSLIREISIDVKKGEVIKIKEAKSISLTDEERYQAIEIFKKFLSNYQTFFDISKIEIIDINGFGFSNGYKFAVIYAKIDSFSGRVLCVIDLKKGKVISGLEGSNVFIYEIDN